MTEISDTNVQHVLEDPGAYFDSPKVVPESSLSLENKLSVLKAWRQWLLSDDMHADHTDEDHVNRHLAEIDAAKATIEAKQASGE